MAIQLNLLPDVKTQYIQAEQKRRTVIFISIIVIAASAGLVAIMLSVIGTQKIALNNVDKDITRSANKLKETQDIEKMLTVQAQLGSLDKLHGDKSVNSRLFGYLAKIVPSNVQISDLDINYEDSSMIIKGTTDSLQSNNVFVDTLKFTNYKTTDNETLTPAFSNVVLSSFSRDDKGTSFTVNLNYDPILFSTTGSGVELVPKQGVTTRETAPNALFNKQAETGTQNGQN